MVDGGEEESCGLPESPTTEPRVVRLALALETTPERAAQLIRAQMEVFRTFAHNLGLKVHRFEGLVWAEVLALYLTGEEPLPTREEIQKLFPGVFTDWRDDDGDDNW